MNWRSGLVIAALGGVFLLAGAAPARADNCFKRIAKERAKLDREIRRHGFDSRQAFQRRAHLRRLEWQCRGNFHDRRWDRGRDWDRRWDRGRDRNKWDIFGRRFRDDRRFDRRHRHDRWCRH